MDAADADGDRLHYWWVVAPEAAESSACGGDYGCSLIEGAMEPVLGLVTGKGISL